MAFRVEISAQAEEDASSILNWLLSQHAGDTGIRWFLAMEEAIESLSTFPERCPLAQKIRTFLLKYGNCYTDTSLMYTAFCSRSMKR